MAYNIHPGQKPKRAASPKAKDPNPPKNERYTPIHILKSAKLVFRGLDLDPCAEPTNRTGAKRFYTAKDNGLVQQWSDPKATYTTRAFINPPYSPQGTLKEWVKKTLADFPVCFLNGRLTFEIPPEQQIKATSAHFPSVVFYLGNDTPRFIQYFRPHGRIYRRIYGS